MYWMEQRWELPVMDMVTDMATGMATDMAMAITATMGKKDS